MKHGISILAVAAVMLAMAAPAMAVDFDPPSSGTYNFTGSTDGTTQEIEEKQDLKNITINIGTPTLSANVYIGALKLEHGAAGSSSSALNIENATVYIHDLIVGKNGVCVTTLKDGGILTVGGAIDQIDHSGYGLTWSGLTMNDRDDPDGIDTSDGSYISLEGGTLRLYTAGLLPLDTVDSDIVIKGLNGATDATGVTVGTDGDYTTYTAVPEPATMSLLAIGGLALIRRRKRA